MLTSQTIFHSSNKYISSFEKPHGSDSSLNPGILLLFLHAWRQLFEHTLDSKLHEKNAAIVCCLWQRDGENTPVHLYKHGSGLHTFFHYFLWTRNLNYRQHRMQWKPEDWRRLCVASTLETDQKIIYRQGILNLLKSNITQA